MKKLLLLAILPLLFGAFFTGCEPVDEDELPAQPQQQEQPLQ